MREKLPEFQIDLTGDTAEIKAMLAVACRVEPRIFGKQWVDDNHLVLRYRAEAPRTDLLEAIQRAAHQPTAEAVAEPVFDDELFVIDEDQD